jgi:hypothetical protein
VFKVRVRSVFILFLPFSQRWLATPQEVLQADWQKIWHFPAAADAKIFFETLAERARIQSFQFFSMFYLLTLETIIG